MGFLSGVITGVAVAAGAAAWYMSRSGAKVREQYQLEKRLGELGDQMEARSRDIQSQVNAQIAEMRSKGTGNGHDAASDASETLDAATAGAAEAAAEVAADVESAAGKAKKAAKDVADETTS